MEKRDREGREEDLVRGEEDSGVGEVEDERRGGKDDKWKVKRRKENRKGGEWWEREENYAWKAGRGKGRKERKSEEGKRNVEE